MPFSPLAPPRLAISTHEGRSKRIRKTLNHLKHAQKSDLRLPQPCIFEIKHFISRFERTKDSPTNTIPKFIISQLESQGIITNMDMHKWQVFAVLQILDDHISLDPFNWSNSIPTLFFWKDRRGQRPFYLFAYTTLRMDPHSYSVPDLLSLRNTEHPQQLLAKLRENAETRTLLSKERTSENQPAVFHPAASSNHSRASRKSKPISSSTDEGDEVVFQGKNQGEVQWKYRGRTGSECASTEPLSAPVGLDKQQSEGFQRFFKAVVSPTHVRVTAGGRIVPNTRGSVSPTAKWDKEKAGDDAQDSAEPSKEATTGSAASTAYGQMPRPMITPLYAHQQMGPLVYQHAGMQMPLYPVPHGYMPYPMAPATSPAFSHIPFPPTTEGQKAVRNENNIAVGPDNRAQQPAVQLSPPDQFDQTRPCFPVSYPVQVDGQAMYPLTGITQVPQPRSYQVVGNSLIQHPVAVYPGSAQQPVAAPTPVDHSQRYALNSLCKNSDIVYTGGIQDYHLQWAKMTLASLSATPHVSSIRPSEITRKQVENMKTALKHYINQLEHNRHQIDEPWAFAQAKMLQEEVVKFETIQRAQEVYEKERYPAMEPTPAHIAAQPFMQTQRFMPHHMMQAGQMVMPISNITPSRAPSIRHNQESGSSHHGSKRSHGRHAAPRHFQPPGPRMAPFVNAAGGAPAATDAAPRRRSRNAGATGINTTKQDQSTDHIDSYQRHLIDKFSADDATEEEKEALRKMTQPLMTQEEEQPSTSLEESSDNTSSNNTQKTQPSSQSTSQDQSADAKNTLVSGAYLAPNNTYGASLNMKSPGAYPGNAMSSYLAPVIENNVNAPYLVGNPAGMYPWGYNRGIRDYVYARELTEDEKQARDLYWNQQPNKGTGLPKFDGKDFWAPSPEKPHNGQHERNGSSHQADTGLETRSSDADPFRSSQDKDSIRSQKTERRLSKAIPIVAPPPETDKKATSGASTTRKTQVGEGVAEVASNEGSSGTPSAQATRRLLERSRYVLAHASVNNLVTDPSKSTKSGQDLWQTILKKGSTSGAALTGTVSSTTATGYLPQYYGNAVASLGPTISNMSPVAASLDVVDKLTELEAPRSATEKSGENCPPSSAPSLEHDVTKDLHERMLRDAKRRGVIGSDWQ
ncbi:hypothetical protein F5Y18DRAFT_414711 [Xylariaceae sp. FL1019]|nr:hypothetical protein F5Y18DRAFT_414711 [Xylariaceae sp. FL1019]